MDAEDTAAKVTPRLFHTLTQISNIPRTANVATLLMTIPIPLQEALRDSITSGSFVDTKFWVFSRRDPHRECVGGPKALFFNERVARRVPRLGARTVTAHSHPRSHTNPLTVLDECKNKGNLRTRFPASKKPYARNYDYEDDSDLEEEEDDDYDYYVSDIEPAVPPRVPSEKPGNDSSEFATSKNSDAKCSESSDVMSVSDLDSLFSEPPDTKDEIQPAHVGKVVIIEDVAFVT